jgi:hypothetical protein
VLPTARVRHSAVVENAIGFLHTGSNDENRELRAAAALTGSHVGGHEDGLATVMAGREMVFLLAPVQGRV